MSPSKWTPGRLYDEYATQHGLYKSAAEDFQTAITSGLNANGVPCRSVVARAKKPEELFKKQMKKNYQNPWSDCPDLVGARVVVPISTAKPLVAECLRNLEGMEVFDVEDQAVNADPTVLRYKGLHLHIRSSSILNGWNEPIRCEVQIRTVAEDSWADTEHRYIYKGPGAIPSDVRRVFSRLLVLVELFDQELAKGVEMVTSLPEYEQIRFVRELEERFTSRIPGPTDQDITLDALKLLQDTGVGDVSRLRSVVRRYLEDRQDEVEKIWAAHGPGTSGFNIQDDWVLTQPESLLLLALLDENEYSLSNSLRNTDLYETTASLALWSGHNGFVD